jgi:hypothetical protein
MTARLTDDLRSPIAARYPLTEVAAALKQVCDLLLSLPLYNDLIGKWLLMNGDD